LEIENKINNNEKTDSMGFETRTENYTVSRMEDLCDVTISKK
jgi:hypothetical protein